MFHFHSEHCSFFFQPLVVWIMHLNLSIMKFFGWIVAWKKQVGSKEVSDCSLALNAFLAEAINRSFNEIKSYVENRRHNLLHSLKTTRDYKLKVLNDQLNLILSKENSSDDFVFFICFNALRSVDEKSKIEGEGIVYQHASDIHVLTQRIQELNDRIERMSLLGEPRENSFMKFEFRHNQALQDLARSLNSVGRIRVSSTYPPLCRAKIEPPVANLQCAIHIETVDYNGNVRIDGGDPLTVNIWDPYGKLREYDLHDKQSGSYTIIFRPLMSGNHKIDIRIFDRPISGSPFVVDVTKHNNPLWSFGKRGRAENELSMPVSVIVDDGHQREQVFILDPGNSRIKCLSIDGKFLEHLGTIDLLVREFLFHSTFRFSYGFTCRNY